MKKRCFFLVLPVLIAGVVPVRAFDRDAYQRDSFYGTTPFFSVVTPLIGIRYEYLPGIKDRKTVYPVYGSEHFLRLDNPARSDYVFLKSRLMLSGYWTSGEVGSLPVDDVMFQTGAALLFGYSWTLKRSMLFVDRISPFVAIGASYEYSQITRFLDHIPVSGSQGINAMTIGGAYQAGAEFNVVRHLFGIRVQLDGVTGVRLTDTFLGFVSHPISQASLSVGFVFYDRIFSNE